MSGFVFSCALVAIGLLLVTIGFSAAALGVDWAAAVAWSCPVMFVLFVGFAAWWVDHV